MCLCVCARARVRACGCLRACARVYGATRGLDIPFWVVVAAVLWKEEETATEIEAEEELGAEERRGREAGRQGGFQWQAGAGDSRYMESK